MNTKLLIFLMHQQNTTKIYNLTLDTSNPLDQFEIRDLFSFNAPIFGNLHISLTNIGLYLIIGIIFLLILNVLSTNFNRLVGNN